MKNLLKITIVVLAVILIPKLTSAQMSPFNNGAQIANISGITIDNQTGNDIWFQAEINEAGTCRGMIGGGLYSLPTLPTSLQGGDHYFIQAGGTYFMPLGFNISGFRFGFNTLLPNYCNSGSGVWLQDGSCSHPTMLHDNGCNTIGIGPSYVSYQFNGSSYDCDIILTP
jgi:hypothetical protein